MNTNNEQHEQRTMDMGDAISGIWQAMDVIHASEHLTMDDLDEIVDQGRHSWSPDEADNSDNEFSIDVRTVMDHSTRQALRDVIQYNWDDECEDFKNAVKQGDIEHDDDGHVFTKLVKLENYLSDTNVKPSDFLDTNN